jgi:hypothetical protein
MIPNFDSIISISLKIFTLIGLGVYFIFALIVVKQVSVMSQNIHDLYNSHLRIFSYFHLLFSVLVILLAIFLL